MKKISEKFKERSHHFTLFGLIFVMITLFPCLQLATGSLMANITISFLLETMPFVFICIFYRLRK